MGVRLKRYSSNGMEQREWTEEAVENRTTTVDGYSFHWSPNQVRNFMDEGVGAAHGAFSSTDGIVEDAVPFGTSRF